MKTATKILLPVALVAAGWSAGFFMGCGAGGLHGNSSAPAASENPGGTGGK